MPEVHLAHAVTMPGCLLCCCSLFSACCSLVQACIRARILAAARASS